MTLELQFYMFAVMVIAGVVVSGWYDLYRAARFVFGWSHAIGELADLLFVFVSALFIVIGLVVGTWGSFRSYTILGLLVGAWLYFSLASALMQPLWRMLFRGILAIWSRFKAVMSRVANVFRTAGATAASGLTKIVSSFPKWSFRKPPAA